MIAALTEEDTLRRALEKLQPEPVVPSTPPPAEFPQPALAAVPSARDLYDMIAEAAYFRAEKRGFAPGLEADDWQEAEDEVLARFRAASGR
jgi:hypothetical protein